MKRLLILLMMIVSADSFASGIGNVSSAPCDNATLNKYTGTANVEINWEPNTINLNWYDGDTKLTVANNAQSCVYDGTLTVPTQPTKPGYTFNGWKVIRVPGGFTELEYIETTSAGPYINTGISPHSDNVVYQVSWLETQLESAATIFGSTKFTGGQPSWPVSYYHHVPGGTYIAIGKSNSQCSQNNIVVNRVNTAEVIVSNGTFTKTQNGDTCTGTYSGTIQNGVNISLFFNYGYSGQLEYCAHTRMFYWKMYDNNELVRNFIPARRNSDNVVGMYDSITNQFFTNAGTGTFVAGPAVQ